MAGKWSTMLFPRTNASRTIKLNWTGESGGNATMREKVKVVDVTARDGLQNEPKPVSTRDKLELIDKLVHAGVTDIQATSFVHPKWVPQMADAEGVAAGLEKYKDITFSA